MARKILTVWKNGAVVTSRAMKEAFGNLDDGDLIYVSIEKVYCSEAETREQLTKRML
jgi:hypothetical protein